MSGIDLTIDGPDSVNLSVTIDREIGLTVDGPVRITAPASASSYRHPQVVAISPWVVNHNLGRAANGVAYDNTGRRVLCTVDEVSLNTTAFTFASPFSGYAIIS